MADNRNTLTDEILVLAETLGDIKSRFERVEAEFETQSKPLEAALSALSAAMTGIKTLQHHVLDNSLSELSLKVEEQRKAIDEQITVLVGELKGADQKNAEKIALQTAELKTQFAAISDSVRQLSSQFEAQIKRVELEAKQEMTKFAAIAGPQGPAGASINPRGNWVDGIAYNRLDVVSLLGTSYISAVDNNTIKPTRSSDKWTVLARSGTGGGGAANFASLAGVAEINQGGTGQTTALAGARALLDGISTTRGTILYRGSDGWSALTAGAADTVLKSQGAGADPQWAATSSATAATNAQAAAGTSTTTFITPANAEYAAAPVVNGRAARQGLVFDGTAAANSVTAAALGTGDFTISWWQNVQNNANGYGTLLSGASGPLIQNFDGSGRLQIIRGDGVGGSLNTSSAVVTGKWEFWTIARTSGTATWYKNGVADSSGLLGSDFTGNSYIWGQGGTYKIQGSVSGCLIYNRALSAAEVVALYEAGVPAGADYNTASNTSIITGANSDFSSDTGYWIKTGTASIGSGVCTLPGVSSIYRAGLTTVGKRYRLTATLSGGSVTITNADLVTYGTISGAGTGSLEFTAQTAAAIQIVNYTGSITIDNVLLVPVGLLLAPDAGQAGNGYVWNDVSGNVAQIALPSSGVTWNVPSVAGNRIRGTTNTNGNQQLLGASVLLPAESQILHVRARSRSGTPSITIGTSSGGAEIVASVALSTTWKNLTIALTGGIVSSADDIWIGSNSTDVVETDISWQPLDF
jgi:hypothetical protein